MKEIKQMNLSEIKEELENSLFEDHEGNIEHVDLTKGELVKMIDQAYCNGEKESLEKNEGLWHLSIAHLSTTARNNVLNTLNALKREVSDENDLLPAPSERGQP